MGYKQSLLQRLQTIEMSAQTKNQSDTKHQRETDFHQPSPHVTDFSIQRILGAPQEKKFKPNQSPATTTPSSITPDTPPTSPKLYAPVAQKPLNSADILDLSKSKSTESYNISNLNSATELSYSSAAFQYPALHPNILAAVAAANAQKFYAQFFPHMFQGGLYMSQHALTRTMPTTASYQKRYFAPYVLNNNNNNNNNNSVTSTITSTALPATSSHSHHSSQAPLTPTTPTHPSTLPLTPAKRLCSRLDCIDCIDSYYKNPSTPMQYPYKTPILSPAASSVSSASSYHSKGQKDMMLGSSSSISLTSVTNIHLSSGTKSSKAVYSTASLFDGRSSSSQNTINLEEISYKCRICDKVFGCSQTLQAHEKTHKSPRYECTDCGKGFSQLRNYKYHLSVHRGTKEFAAECPECGKTFNDKGYLSSHMKIHRNKKEYECPYCPKSFNQRVAFNMHVRIHTGVKPHKCVECGKRFSRKMLLKQHMRTHSGEKPYQCSVCGKSFADRSNMTLHHRLHSGIKPFNCPICPKAFTKKHHLKTHLNYHTGCKPYVCPHTNCNQAFTQSSNMRTHAKKCQYRPLQITDAYPERTMAGGKDATVPSNSSAISANQSLFINSISRLPSTAVTTSTSGNLYHNMTSSGNVSQSNIPSSFIPSTTLSAGIRMLSTASSTVTAASSAAFPPAQQPLLSTMRPF